VFKGDKAAIGLINYQPFRNKTPLVEDPSVIKAFIRDFSAANGSFL